MTIQRWFKTVLNPDQIFAKTGIKVKRVTSGRISENSAPLEGVEIETDVALPDVAVAKLDKVLQGYARDTGKVLDATWEADWVEVKDNLLDRGRLALNNWATLTMAQKDAVLKALLRYVLYKEG